MKHPYSDEYKEEKENEFKLIEINNLMLFNFLIKINGLDDMDLTRLYNYSGYLDDSQAADFIINVIGYEKLENDINIYNSTIEKMNVEGKIPNAKQMLNGVVPNIYDECLSRNIRINK